MSDDNDMTFTTSSGKTISSAEIQAFADEFAATESFDVDEIKRRGRPSLGNGVSEIIQFRIDRELAERLEARVETDHSTRSELIREALNQFLAS